MQNWWFLSLTLVIFLVMSSFVFGLSDLQIVACEAADQSGTCDRLAELGMVTKEECCSELGKCCTTTQTCSQAGGSCKNNTCGSYSDCSSVSGSCTSGYCCSGSCTTPAQTCSQAGGSCKNNTCGSYSDCSSVSGSCTSGYCCSGNCTTTITAEVCSSDIECAQCGNACIPKTQWSSSCASPTINFDCKCISNSCTLILKEAEKTMLPDCAITCVNQNGCICPLGCQNVGETTYGMNCGGKKIPSVEEVSLCEGCLIDDRTCLEVGTQKQEADGTTFYCSSDKKLETAKEAGENCNNDYECLTYTCKEGICFEELKEEGEGKSSQIILIVAVIVIVLGLIFFTLKFLSAKKTVVQGEKKIEKKGFEIQEPKQKYAYRYRPEFDVLEKKLKESLKTKK